MIRFTKVDETLFNGRWGWLVQLKYNYEKKGKSKTECWSDPSATETIAYMCDVMNARANGHFIRKGNIFFFERLKDAFEFRIMFDEHIKQIKQSKDALMRKWRV